MSFISIANTVPGALTYNQAGTGKYINANTTFGGVQDYYALSAVRKTKPIGGASTGYSFGINRYQEYDNTVGSVTTRLACRVRLVVEIDDGFPLANVDAMLRQIDEFVSTANVTRILNGEV